MASKHKKRFSKIPGPAYRIWWAKTKSFWDLSQLLCCIESRLCSLESGQSEIGGELTAPVYYDPDDEGEGGLNKGLILDESCNYLIELDVIAGNFKDAGDIILTGKYMLIVQGGTKSIVSAVGANDLVNVLPDLVTTGTNFQFTTPLADAEPDLLAIIDSGTIPAAAAGKFTLSFGLIAFGGQSEDDWTLQGTAKIQSVCKPDNPDYGSW